jgi:hypothetical protein
MPQIINCPDCHRKLRIPDSMLGKKVQCPGCGLQLKAVAVGPGGEEKLEELEELEEAPKQTSRSTMRRRPGSEDRISARPQRSSARSDEDDRRRSRRRDEDEDYPRSRRYRDEEEDPQQERRGWQKVRMGLQLVSVGLWVWIGCTFLAGMLLMIVAVLFFHAAGTLGSEGPTESSVRSSVTSAGLGFILLMGSGGLFAIGTFFETLLRLIGYGLCIAVPNKRGTALRPLAITAFALAALSTLFSTGNTLLNLRGHGSGVISIGVGLIALAGFIVFLFSVRSMCRYVGERRLGGQMITALIVFIVYPFLSGIILFVLMLLTVGSVISGLTSGGQNQANLGAALDNLGIMGVVAILVTAVIVLGYLGLEIWFISLLQRVRAALDAYRRELLE